MYLFCCHISQVIAAKKIAYFCLHTHTHTYIDFLNLSNSLDCFLFQLIYCNDTNI